MVLMELRAIEKFYNFVLYNYIATNIIINIENYYYYYIGKR